MVSSCRLLHYVVYKFITVVFLSDFQNNLTDYQVEPARLSLKILLEKVKSVYDT